MKKVLACSFALICAIGSFALSQEAATAPKGKFGGLMFGDYFYNIKYHDTTKQDLNGFQFRRIYFSYDYAISTDFDTRFRLEADQSALSSNNKILPFVKDAWLRWKNVFEGQDLLFGISPTPAFDISEGAWGYRALEKTILDLNGIVPARDFGVDMRGKITGDGMINYWAKIGNNSSTSPEADKYKRYYGLLWFKPTAALQATVYADYESEPNVFDAKLASTVANGKTTYAAFVNYSEANSYSLGVEAFGRTITNGFKQPQPAASTLANQDQYGVTLFGWGSLSNQVRLIGRVDFYDASNALPTASNPHPDGNTLVIAALDYLPQGTDIHLMPNFYYVKYHADVTSDIIGRVTVWYNFH